MSKGRCAGVRVQHSKSGWRATGLLVPFRSACTQYGGAIYVAMPAIGSDGRCHSCYACGRLQPAACCGNLGAFQISHWWGKRRLQLFHTLTNQNYVSGVVHGLSAWLACGIPFAAVKRVEVVELAAALAEARLLPLQQHRPCSSMCMAHCMCRGGRIGQAMRRRLWMYITCMYITCTYVPVAYSRWPA